MPDTTGTIDFGRLKLAAPIEQVLAFYGVSLKRMGTQLVGRCPIHKGSNPRAFVVSPAKNVWRCFGDCDRGGSVVDLVALLENASPVAAARLIARRLGLDVERHRVGSTERSHSMSSSTPTHKVYVVEGEGDEAFWTRVGSAWAHKDGKGFNVTLSALPTNGRLVLRVPNEDDAKEEERAGRGKRR